MHRLDSGDTAGKNIARCESRGIAVFGAYFDESGTHQGSPVLVVAGYLSTVEQWVHFDHDWSRFLQDFGIAGFFHMTDFESRWGQYRDWPDEKRHRCIDRITSILSWRTQFRAAFAVNVQDYHELFPGNEVTPYAFCVWEWMKEAERWMDRYSIHDTVAYTFERGSGRGAEIESNFVWMLQRRPDLRRRYRLGSYSFADKREVLRLQASDFFAYESWKRLLNNVLPAEKRRSRRSVVLLLRRAKHHAYYHGREHLEKFKHDLDSFVDPLEKPRDYQD
jgi:hypothetical protein